MIKTLIAALRHAKSKLANYRHARRCVQAKRKADELNHCVDELIAHVNQSPGLRYIKPPSRNAFIGQLSNRAH